MITGWQLVQVATDWVTADLIIWKVYRRPTPGLVEAMLDANPQLAYVHRTTPWIPVGVWVRVPIDPSLMSGAPARNGVAGLWPDISTINPPPS